IIITFIVEVKWVFSPILVVAQAIFIPLLISGVLFYITVPLQTILEKRKVPRWGSIIIIICLIIGFIWAALSVVGPPITKEFNNLVDKAPTIIEESNAFVVDLIKQADSLPQWAIDSLDEATTNVTSS